MRTDKMPTTSTTEIGAHDIYVFGEWYLMNM